MISHEKILGIFIDAKRYAVNDQRYELAAQLRDTERLIQNEKIDRFDLELRCEKLISNFPDIESYISPLLILKNRQEKLDKLFGED